MLFLLLITFQFAWGAVARVFAQEFRKLQQSLSVDDPRLDSARKDLVDIVQPIRILAGIFPILGEGVRQSLNQYLTMHHVEFQLERLNVYDIEIPETQ